MKKISIVVPTYRRPKLLYKCLEALTRQTFDKYAYEIIIVSDGKDHPTEALVKNCSLSLAHTIRFCSLPKKKGPAAARNLGWSMAKGQLIAFTDDDCLPEKDWLVNLWRAYQGEDYVAFSGKVHVPISSEPTDYELNTANLEKADFITANCCCTRKALELTGGFDERFEAAWREDSDLEFKLLKSLVPIKKVENALVVHPVRKTEWGISIKEQRKGMFNALLYKKYPSLYRQKIQKRPEWEYYAMIFCFLILLLSSPFHVPLALLAGAVWLGLVGNFIFKRLAQTTRRMSHVVEMVLTSFVIPFTSVYWQLYGAIKYRVLFL